ncbi:MAG: peptidoglycan bridge formation glycyltransferase FemA/FemB family protein, partial [Verrucomicrobiales bacterium]|nr:peptidoglycan bridge formation glycyltransferase FemA/FemB family protein [Verrucomicrobiales bacterium]
MQTAFEVAAASLSDTQWHDILDRFDDSSVYQTRAFGEACWNPRQLSHFVLRRGGEVLAAAQVRLVTVPVLRRGVAYVRWGPMFRRKGAAAAPEIFAAAMASLRDTYVRRKGLLLRVIPNVYTGEPIETRAREILANEGFAPVPDISPYHTHRVRLTESVETLRKNLSQRWRSKLKNAEQSGYTITRSDSNEDYARFLGAYDEMMERKRFETTVDVREFAEMQRRLLPGTRLQVFLCEKDGQLLNALVVAAAGDTGIYLLAATSNAGLNGNGAFLLQWTAIQWLKESGRTHYDLGGVNPDANPGVYQFKSGMGGDDVRQLGQFQSAAAPLSRWIVTAAERYRQYRRSRTARPKLDEKPADQPAPVT